MSLTPILDTDGNEIGVICHEPVEEIKREPNGCVRWCFHCRTRRAFDYVVIAPIGISYYGPCGRIECAVCHTEDGDCFPGWSRGWSDD